MKNINNSLSLFFHSIKTAGYAFLIPTILSLIIGITCMQVFFKADYFQDGSSDKTVWETYYGYTIAQFVALYFATWLLPLGLLFTLIFAFQSFKYDAENAKTINIVVYTVMATFFFAGCGLAYNELDASDIIKCGIFCYGASETTISSPTLPAFMISIGTIYFILAFILGFMFVFLIGLTIAKSANPSYEQVPLKLTRKLNVDENAQKDPDESSPLLSSTTSPMHRNDNSTSNIASNPVQRRFSTTKWVAILLTFATFYPIMFLACISLPTWWNNFTRDKILTYESSEPSEVYGAYYKIRVNDSLLLKIYPDIIMYYGFIYLVAIIAILGQIYPVIGDILCHRPRYFPIDVSVGEFWLTTMIIAIVCIQFYYFYSVHKFQNSDTVLPDSEMVARAFGSCANLVAGLLVLPVSKNSVWTYVFGVSWDAMLIFHKYMGGLLLVLILCHMFSWWKYFAYEGYFPSNIFHVPLLGSYSDDFTVPLAQLTAFGMFLFIGVGALEWVRRWNYDFFYYLHHFFMVFFLVMLIHATMSWYYITAGLALWAVDHIIRLSRSIGYAVAVQDISVTKGDNRIVQLSYLVSRPTILSKVTALNPFLRDGFGPLPHEMGQFVYINIPQVSTMAWHPFSISSSPNDPITTHHIKVMPSKAGGAEWTEKLYQLGETLNREDLRTLVVNIEGPYGTALPCYKYREILLVAGGIGVTPLMSTYKHLFFSRFDANRSAYAHITHVHLIWVVKTYEDAKIFESTLKEMKNISDSKKANSMESGDGNSSIRSTTGPHCRFTLYVTQNESHEFNADLNVIKGRPDLRKEIGNLATLGTEAVVFSCGPMGLVDDCAKITKEFGVSFRYETFLL